MFRHVLLRCLVAERLMEPLGFVPDPVKLPANLSIGQRGVRRPIDLLGLVLAEEALDVRLVLRALDSGVLNPDSQRVGRLLEATGSELGAPIQAQRQDVLLGYPPSEASADRFFESPDGLLSPASVSKDRSRDSLVAGVNDGEQVAEPAPTPNIGQVHLPVRVAHGRPDDPRPGPALTFRLAGLQPLHHLQIASDRLVVDLQTLGCRAA